MNEEIPMESWNETLLFNGQAVAGKFCRIFDSNYYKPAEEWGYFPVDANEFENTSPAKGRTPRA